jgi:hypothetical protein
VAGGLVSRGGKPFYTRVPKYLKKIMPLVGDVPNGTNTKKLEKITFTTAL